MKKVPDNQLAFAIFAPPTVTPQGDGSVVLKPGKALIWLTPKQVGHQFNVDRDTVYRWRQEGLIEDKFVKFAGLRKILISAQAVPILEAHFRAHRD